MLGHVDDAAALQREVVGHLFDLPQERDGWETYRLRMGDREGAAKPEATKSPNRQGLSWPRDFTPFPRGAYQRIFAPSCTCRASKVDVIVPKLALLRFDAGGAKLTRLNRVNASIRDCRRGAARPPPACG